MENIFNDSIKIELYSHIQEELCLLEPNASDETIDKFMDIIPKGLLDQKEDLTIICYLFAYYPRNKPKNVRKNAMKLFEKIMAPLKIHMQNESSFFWNIFGGLYYFKQLMYEENLITIEKIVQESKIEETVAEYFLPEIIEKAPEYFEKELKHKIQTPYNKEYIDEFKKLRKNHLKWLKESNDYSDPFYKEIEKDPLRLCIKTDDIDTFQSILSKSNISVDSFVQESVLENSYFRPYKSPLIDFAIEFDSIKIFKYLIMSNAKVEDGCVFSVIRNGNYEMIHIIESYNQSAFKKFSILHCISCWNFEVLNYSMENYDSIFDDEIKEDNHEKILNIFGELCYSINFHFFESILLPFLQKNSKFLNDNINEFLYYSFQDQSTYFAKELLKHPNVNVNYIHNYKSIICSAISYKNAKAVNLLLNNPKIDISIAGVKFALPFQYACVVLSDIEILELFCSSKKLNIDWKDKLYGHTAFNYAVFKGNFYAIDIISKYFPDYYEIFRVDVLIDCIKKYYFLTVKRILILYQKVWDEDDYKQYIDIISNHLNEPYLNTFKQIIQEISD